MIRARWKTKRKNETDFHLQDPTRNRNQCAEQNNDYTDCSEMNA